MKNGYAYKFTGEGSWRESPDDAWEIVMTNKGRAAFIGFRIIDGTRCTVWRDKRGTYAQTESSAPAPRGMR